MYLHVIEQYILIINLKSFIERNKYVPIDKLYSHYKSIEQANIQIDYALSNN